jgi:hypothetical protein
LTHYTTKIGLTTNAVIPFIKIKMENYGLALTVMAFVHSTDRHSPSLLLNNLAIREKMRRHLVLIKEKGGGEAGVENQSLGQKLLKLNFFRK